MSEGAEDLFARWVEHHVLHGEHLDPGSLCVDQPGLLPELTALIARYLDVSGSLDGLPRRGGGQAPAEPAGSARLPQFEGFRTIERLGAGGMGEVYKLHDLKLDRLVAAKVIRRDRGRTSALAGFLAEARAMALFQDRRIVQ
ncbi:MAG: hypothetical protein ACM3H9_03225, partial [Rhodospirillaceae bacterium]